MSFPEYPASISQRLLWTAAHHAGESACATARVYSLPNMDESALEHALTDLRGRHEALRTHMVGAGPELRQQVLDAVPLRVEWEDRPWVRHGNHSAVRVHGRRNGPDGVITLEIDHLLTDGRSFEVIRADLAELYAARVERRPPRLGAAGWQYRQFAEWQSDRLQGARLERLQSAWLRRLDGAMPAHLPKPTQRPDPGERIARVQPLRADAGVASALRALASAGNTTPDAAALGVFFLELVLLTGQDDLTISSIFANRTEPKVWRTVGLFAHLLPLRLALGGSSRVTEVLRLAGEAVAHGLANQELPMSLLPSGAIARQDFIDIGNIVFQVQPTSAPGEDEDDPGAVRTAPDVEATRTAPGRAASEPHARFDLELSLSPRGSGLRGFIRYAADRFAPDWIGAFRDLFFELALAAAAEPELTVSELRPRLGARVASLATR